MHKKEHFFCRFFCEKNTVVLSKSLLNTRSIRLFILVFAIFLTPSTAFSNYYIDEIAGTWESKSGILYKSDGSNFVCHYIPGKYMGQYGHWLNKNGLTGFRYTKDGLTVLQYFRTKSGKIYQVPTLVELGDNTITLRYTISSKNRTFERTFNRRSSTSSKS